jgi:hypothetical protein
MLKLHREKARREIETLLMDTRSISTPDMNWLVWELFGVKDPKIRILDVDSKGMSQVLKDARSGGILFEANSSQKTILENCSTPAQAELWKFFGQYRIHFLCACVNLPSHLQNTCPN